MRQAEKEIKEFQTRIPLILDPGEKIPKENVKKLKKLKNIFLALFLAKAGSDRMSWAEKEMKVFQTRIPFILDPGEKIPRENAKKFKKFKNNFPSLFLAKTE